MQRVQIPFHSTSFITLFFLFHKFEFRVVLQISKFVGRLSHFKLKSPSICNSHVVGITSFLLYITWQILDQGQLKTSLCYTEFLSDLPTTQTIITNCYKKHENLDVQMHYTIAAVKYIRLYFAFSGS